MLTSSPTPPAVKPILTAYPMKHLQVPSVVDLLDTVYPNYPYNKTFDEARLEPFVVMYMLLLILMESLTNSHSQTYFWLDRTSQTLDLDP
jgi:hypothetical protein